MKPSTNLRPLQEPILSRVSVGHSLLSREGFRSHNEQSRFRVEFLQRFSHVSSVDVGDKMEAEALVVGF